MLKLKAMIMEAGYEDKLGHAVAMAAAYFNQSAPLKPRKIYSLQEVKELFEFLFEIRTNEINSETSVALQLLSGDEKGAEEAGSAGG